MLQQLPLQNAWHLMQVLERTAGSLLCLQRIIALQMLAIEYIEVGDCAQSASRL